MVIKRRAKYFLSNTNLHGFKYLYFNREYQHAFWKRAFTIVFWSIVISISVVFLGEFLHLKLFSSNMRSTSINFDTSYRDWNNTFPAISLCLTKGRSLDSVKVYVTNYFKENNLKAPKRSFRFFRAVQNLMFLNPQQPLDGVDLNDCREYNETCGVNFTAIREMFLPQKCDEFVKEMKFLGKPIDCKNYFFKHETEAGLCYTANGLADAPETKRFKKFTSFRNLPLKHSNMENIRRSMYVKYNETDLYNLKIFVHSPEEVASGRLEALPSPGIKTDSYFAINAIEMINNPDVINEDIAVRGCRYPSEKIEAFNLHYSSTNCHRDLRMANEIKSCNCTLDIGDIPKSVRICLPEEIQCIVDVAKKVDLDEEQCMLPSCVSMTIHDIGKITSDSNDEDSSVTIEVLNKPTLRFVRRVKESKLDQIVQLGGLVGLFLGASILSLVEVVFLIVDPRIRN
jgi:acid-sensing ion channel, other